MAKMLMERLGPAGSLPDSLQELLSADNPVLTNAAKHFFEKRHGKRFRPTIVMLMCKSPLLLSGFSVTPCSR